MNIINKLLIVTRSDGGGGFSGEAVDCGGDGRAFVIDCEGMRMIRERYGIG